MIKSLKNEKNSNVYSTVDVITNFSQPFDLFQIDQLNQESSNLTVAITY